MVQGLPPSDRYSERSRIHVLLARIHLIGPLRTMQKSFAGTSSMTFLRTCKPATVYLKQAMQPKPCTQISKMPSVRRGKANQF